MIRFITNLSIAAVIFAAGYISYNPVMPSDAFAALSENNSVFLSRDTIFVYVNANQFYKEDINNLMSLSRHYNIKVVNNYLIEPDTLY